MPPKADKSAPAAPAPPEGPFWFSVRYGDDQTQLFNMDCRASVLVDHMKQKCGYGHFAEGVDRKTGAATLGNSVVLAGAHKVVDAWLSRGREAGEPQPGDPNHAPEWHEVDTMAAQTTAWLKKELHGTAWSWIRGAPGASSRWQAAAARADG